MIVQCQLCEKPFRAFPSGRAKFCSHICYWNNLRRVCQFCGTHMPAGSGSRRKYCSLGCREAGKSRNISQRLKGRVIRQGFTQSETTKGKIGASNRGKLIGRTRSADTKRKIATALRIYCNKPEVRAERRRQMLVRWRSLRSDPEGLETYVKRTHQFRKPNCPERALGEILDAHFPMAWEYTGDGKVVLGGMIPDFSHRSRRAVIELFGRYWHGRKADNWRDTELGKIMAYNALGIKCLVIWEDDVKHASVVAKVEAFMSTCRGAK